MGLKLKDDFTQVIEFTTAVLLSFAGWIGRTALFYGYYSGTFKFEFGGVTFDFPSSFFFVMLSILLVNMLAVMLKAAQAVKVANDTRTHELADYQTAEFIFR